MNAPEMAGWNLALRFGLELAALAGIAIAAWRLSPDTLRWATVIAGPVAAATMWGVFNVVGDPSRSGAAPVEVSGWTRLAVEILILGVAAMALGFAGEPRLAVGMAALITLQYATSWTRVEWMTQV